MKIKKQIQYTLNTILLFTSATNLLGCASSHAPSLTTVPQSNFIKSAMHPPQEFSAERPTKAKFLSGVSPEVKKAYLYYAKTGHAPLIETDKFQQFPFGDTQPIVACAPLNVCDIELQKGEVITGVKPGDTARWVYDEVYSGEGLNRQPHVLFKPKDYNISTNVVIATTNHTYYLGLVSKSNSYIRQIKFYYPEDMEKYWETINHKADEIDQHHQEKVVTNISGIDPTQLDDHYTIKSNSFFSAPVWKPVRALNDGTHVYIEMPAQIRVTDAPTLYIMDSDGNQALVNYRVKGNYYIVDTLFKEARLISGVGSNQNRVTITYNG